MPADAAITEPGAGDVAQLRALLRQNGLPDEDCAEQLPHFVGIFDDARLIAAGCLQPAGEFALLRSLVVDPAYRSGGLGQRISEFLLERAATRPYRGIYLLTETAQAYFTRFGFVEVERASAPAAIAATRQFAALCPGSAVCMLREPADRHHSR